MTLPTFLPWVMSTVTIAQMWLTGNRWRYVWLLALANGAVWTTWSVATASWGFMPLNVFSAVVAVRNHFLWLSEAKRVGA